MLGEVAQCETRNLRQNQKGKEEANSQKVAGSDVHLELPAEKALGPPLDDQEVKAEYCYVFEDRGGIKPGVRFNQADEKCCQQCPGNAPEASHRNDQKCNQAEQAPYLRMAL